MNKTYTIEGMTCEGCVAKVSHILQQHASISSVAVVLSNKSATITMSEELAVNELQHLFGTSSKYRVGAFQATIDQESESVFTTYKPLLLIFIFIAATTAIASMNDGKIELMLWMRYFMAGFFIVFSFFKFLNLTGFAESYAMYDVLAKRVKVYGLVYPFLELLLGVAYLTNYEPETTYMITIFLMSFSSIGVIQSVLDKRKIKCACLGAVFNLPMSKITIIENLTMVVMACVMLWKV